MMELQIVRMQSINHTGLRLKTLYLVYSSHQESITADVRVRGLNKSYLYTSRCIGTNGLNYNEINSTGPYAFKLFSDYRIPSL